jgi:hypothetical protein
MPTYVKNRAKYFNPLDSIDISSVIKTLISSPEIRENQIKNEKVEFGNISWKECSDKTFDFLIQISKK